MQLTLLWNYATALSVYVVDHVSKAIPQYLSNPGAGFGEKGSKIWGQRCEVDGCIRDRCFQYAVVQ